MPRADLEMLFPNARVRMRLIDKLLIGVPAVVSGVIMVVTKLVASPIPVLLLLGFWLGARRNRSSSMRASSWHSEWGHGLRRLRGAPDDQFKNRKIQFMKALSENLYFRNLDNDAGVFHHLLDAAEEEEVKEAVLAYHFLRTAQRPLTAELDRRIEDWFVRRWDAVFDFEVDDGVGKLRRLRPGRRRRRRTADGGAAGRGEAPARPDLGRLVHVPLTAERSRQPERRVVELGEVTPAALG